MVKFGRRSVGKKTDGAADVVLMTRGRSKLRLKRYMVVLIAGLIVLGVIGGGLIMYTSTSDTAAVLPTEAEGLSAKVDALEDNPPADDADTVTKVAYYERLGIIKDAAGDFKGAAEAVNTRIRLTTTDTNYKTYIFLADCYHKAGDDEKANAALDSALAMLPDNANPETGYEPESARSMIRFLRSSYNG